MVLMIQSLMASLIHGILDEQGNIHDEGLHPTYLSKSQEYWALCSIEASVDKCCIRA